MSHEEWTAQLSDYVDGQLENDARDAVAAHLQTCEECTRIVGELERVKSWARENVPGPAPTDPWPVILREIEASGGGEREAADESAAVDAALEGSRPRRRHWRVPAPALIAAMLVVVAGSVWLISPDLPERGVVEEQPRPRTDHDAGEPSTESAPEAKATNDEGADAGAIPKQVESKKLSDATGSTPTRSTGNAPKQETSTRKLTGESSPASAPDAEPIVVDKMVAATEPTEDRSAIKLEESTAPMSRARVMSQSVRTSEAEERVSFDDFDKANAELMNAFETHRHKLEPAAADSIMRSLLRIDADIARADSALTVHPDDASVRTRREERRREKIRLLRAILSGLTSEP